MPRMRICVCGKLIQEYEKCTFCQKQRQQKPKGEIERNKVLTTTKWRKFRKRIIERDGGYCQRCLIKFNMVVTSNLQVHHIKPRIKFPDLTFVESNCVTLCALCNQQLGTREQLDFAFEAKEIEREYFL
ncbi:HNH endonuclease [Mesobacillus subterraneus]|uniref:HNH endonuclease n=1 Tax=Mesobacillus subterraneus TaxID=285983 RepID=UPI001CFF0BD9|nr:HNH endonuclease [Mesobacillus subterraneus]WLR53780.1 HNH endonuclease [Mesobacillus subterraneus]